jgi:phosphopantothenoylcysteine decarboxylase/phosphopantothenate--cysteine ligase
MLIAPCSANTLAKLANGLCDTLVNAVYLSARCPVFIAPAMDEDMWLHPSTRANIEKLRSYGNHIVPVGHGELASGLVGEGRMAEPEELVRYLSDFFVELGRENSKTPTYQPLAGLRALVTAGPTYERLDPVRFIGNFSTGKMGIALAESLSIQGAEVTLVLGPTHLSTSVPGIKTVHVESAEEMHAAATETWPESNIAILAAAVADYRPAEVAEQKIKKGDEAFSLQFIKTPDILSSLGRSKREDQTLVGFALETENGLIHAHEKRLRKGADLMVLNSLTDAGAGFGHDTNKVTLIARDGAVQSLPLQSKASVADAIVQKIIVLHSHAAQPA